MNPRRFIVLFLTASIVSNLISFFFTFAARIMQDPRVVFISFVSSILFVFLFSWLYFKEIPTASWRSRLEAIGVWMGLTLIVDAMILYLVLKASVMNLSTFSLFGYSLMILALFVSAYVTKDSDKPISSPDLKLS